ncbi:MAG: hypothetical protein HYY18_19880 [Planctomycetes bacterium]|nr:hypothetical protein [Planctomycetota bacterium]
MKHAWLAALFLAAAAVALADKVVLNDGREYEGLIVEENDKQVKIKTSKATITFPREQIKSVEKGSSAVAERVTRLEALDPENPAGYLDAAEWFAGAGSVAADVATMKRVCNIASRERSLACRAQTILGDYLVGQGERLGAARAYQRAAAADPKNEEAAKKAAETKGEFEEVAKRDLKDLLETVKLVIDARYAEAIPRLRKSRGLFFADQAPPILHKSLKDLADDLQLRVACKPCAGKGQVICPFCGGKGFTTCSNCDGKGVKRGFVAGKGEERFSEKACRSCIGMGSILCTTCKAERSVTITFVGAYIGQAASVQVETTSGKEREQLKIKMSLTTYVMNDGGQKVTSVIAQPVVKGGMKACATCKGIPFAPPETPPDINALNEYRKMIDDRITGTVPLNLSERTGEFCDEDFLDDGCLRFRNGKWIE